MQLTGKSYSFHFFFLKSYSPEKTHSTFEFSNCIVIVFVKDCTTEAVLATNLTNAMLQTA
jgi:hypothetical protein